MAGWGWISSTSDSAIGCVCSTHAACASSIATVAGICSLRATRKRRSMAESFRSSRAVTSAFSSSPLVEPTSSAAFSSTSAAARASCSCGLLASPPAFKMEWICFSVSAAIQPDYRVAASGGTTTNLPPSRQHISRPPTGRSQAELKADWVGKLNSTPQTVPRGRAGPSRSGQARLSLMVVLADKGKGFWCRIHDGKLLTPTTYAALPSTASVAFVAIPFGALALGKAGEGEEEEFLLRVGVWIVPPC